MEVQCIPFLKLCLVSMEWPELRVEGVRLKGTFQNASMEVENFSDCIDGSQELKSFQIASMSVISLHIFQDLELISDPCRRTRGMVHKFKGK